METLVNFIIALTNYNVPTRWGSQLNGNQSAHRFQICADQSPHSLGIPIEWKPVPAQTVTLMVKRPHSLGIPIEWKLDITVWEGSAAWRSPHSLGIPIEWKHTDVSVDKGLLAESPLAGDPN